MSDKIILTGDLKTDEVLTLLQSARDYEQEWLDYGVNRVCNHLEDVDGDWLERWGEEDDSDLRTKFSEINYILSEPAKEFIESFDRALKTPAVSPQLFSICGIGGIGKSTLLEKLELERQKEVRFAKFDFNVKNSNEATPLQIMAKLYGDLECQLNSDDRNSFSNLYEEYSRTYKYLEVIAIEGKEGVDAEQRNLFRELDSIIAREASTNQLIFNESVSRNGNRQSPSTSLMKVKSNLSGAAIEERLRDELLLKHRATRENKHLQELMLNPISLLTNAFIESLIEMQKAFNQPIAIRLDHYEKASPEFDNWLFEYLLKDTRWQTYPIEIVVAGRFSLQRKHSRQRHLIFQRELNKLDKAQTENYLKQIGITEPKQVQQIYRGTNGFPFHLNLIKQQKAEGKIINCSRDNRELADLLLEGMSSNQKQVLQLAACCRWFDEPMIQYLVEAHDLDFQTAVDAERNCFEWLIEQDFIIEENYFSFNNVVRDVLRKMQHKNNKRKFQETHGLLAKYFEQLANEEVHPDRVDPVKYENSQWREYSSEIIYYSLFENRDKGQQILRTHFFAGAYLKQADVAINAFTAIASEADFEHNSLLPSDTRKFLEDVKFAILLGWLVLTLRPEDYVFHDNRENSIKPQIEAGIQKCLNQVHNLDGLAKYVELITKINRHKQPILLLLQARDQALKIASVEDRELSSERLWGLGSAFADLKYYEEALKTCDESLKIKPDSYQALTNRAAALADLKRLEEALKTCEESLKIKRDLYQAWNCKGNILYDLNRYEEAIASYEESLKIKPNSSSTLDNLGNALRLLRHYEDSVNSHSKALQIESDSESFNGRSLSLSLLGRYTEALVDIDQALKIQPKEPLYLANKGIILCRAKRFQEALINIRQALSLDDKNEGGYYGKACYHALRNEIDLAIENLHQAVNLNPQKCCSEAKSNPDFDRIRTDERFQKLMLSSHN